MRAGETFGYPKDSPAFTFELPDSMKAEYQADGTLVCTAKDPSRAMKGVFQPVLNIKNDKDLLFGLNGAIRMIAPQFIMTDLRYPEPFNKDTPSGIHMLTVGARGRADGQDYTIGFIAFSKAGKYYELIVSGTFEALTACDFPNSFRNTAKLTP